MSKMSTKVLEAQIKNCNHEWNRDRHVCCPKCFSGCGVCGSVLVMIRGKYPGDDKREVCPTCLKERMEQINDMSSSTYGQAYMDKP